MTDRLLPASDGTAIARAAVVLVVGVVTVVASRRHREARIFVIGNTLLLLAVMGLRAVH